MSTFEKNERLSKQQNLQTVRLFREGHRTTYNLLGSTHWSKNETSHKFRGVQNVLIILLFALMIIAHFQQIIIYIA
jgi:sulfite exporter TauE/SafE